MFVKCCCILTIGPTRVFLFVSKIFVGIGEDVSCFGMLCLLHVLCLAKIVTSSRHLHKHFLTLALHCNHQIQVIVLVSHNIDASDLPTYLHKCLEFSFDEHNRGHTVGK